MMTKAAQKESQQESTKANSEAKSPIQLEELSVTVLDDMPLVIDRPLQLIDGKAYAVAWMSVKIDYPAIKGNGSSTGKRKQGENQVKRTQWIIGEDGLAYGLGAENNISDLNISVSPLEEPISENFWSPKGVKRFISGKRPDPADVFFRIKSNISRFIDFDGSLSDQNTMEEFVACYILATWLLEAFDVIGYLWPNGQRGSGKTNFLYVVSQMAYLGELILAGGSYPSLRDLADYGATLAFDDAENLSDPKKSDPDKRALLLAGNRRGATVTVKEPIGNRGFKTRRVRAYCPRLYSAINTPDPILGSRSIIIPLSRSNDRRRANADPADLDTWEYDRNNLKDDLWAIALANLKDLRDYNRWVGNHAQLHGRPLQPWRAVLAVARWLDDKGVANLYSRIHRLAIEYRAELNSFDSTDKTLLVIHALNRWVVDAIQANTYNPESPTFRFCTAEIAESAKKYCQEDEWDILPSAINTRVVGRILSTLRLIEVPRPGGRGKRIREITVSGLIELSKSYDVQIPEEIISLRSSRLKSRGVERLANHQSDDGTGEELNFLPAWALGDNVLKATGMRARPADRECFSVN
jgi:hypothetical protein